MDWTGGARVERDGAENSKRSLFCEFLHSLRIAYLQ
jgi:hypothetical protein